ncbi:MAG: organic solvent tolerance protein OstA [Pirellula sp.]|nr:organic solvent tolerance protein OstA [Pirellula sp.]
MERIPIPLTHLSRTALSFTKKRSLSTLPHAHSARVVLACAFVFAISLPALILLSNTASATEIGLPLSDPKFNVNVFARQGTKQQQGVYETITLVGGVKIYQGSVSATAEEAVLWIDRSLPESVYEQQARKTIVELKGNCEVSLGEGQVLKDDQWMGRLFSQMEPTIQADIWSEPIGPPPTLSWNKTQNTKPDVQTAVAWTARDDAEHVRLVQQLMPLPPSNTPSSGLSSPLNNDRNQPGLIIGNPSMGGTVLDAGTMPWTDQNLPAPSSNPSAPESVQAFQLGVPSMGTPGIGAPGTSVPMGNPAIGNPASGNAPPNAVLAPAPISTPLAMSGASPVTPRSVGAKTFQFVGRGGVEPKIEIINQPERGVSIVTISNGMRLRFGDASVATSDGVLDLGNVFIEADRAVIWTSDMTRLLSGNVSGLPVEVYVEGNIVFLQGARRVYAERMYYNVQSEYGMILSAEMLTDAPQYEGILRLKADVIQQRSRENFLAHQAALTSSQLGVPRYWLQADKVELKDRSTETNSTLFGTPVRGNTGNQTGMKATARHNFVYLEGLPIFYWPVLNSNIDTSSYYITGLNYKNDDIFGNQVMANWDLYQLFGIPGFDGTRWTLSTDYLQKRGIGVGTQFDYNVPQALLGGPSNGFVDFWGIRDKGLDVLGVDRTNLTPEETTRGRLLFRHRQYLTPDTEFWAEAGWVSDRNFLEQYFEQEWDTQKDMVTALRLRQYMGNQMLDLWAQTRLNDFHTETDWLPRLEYYWLGQSLGQYFTYYGHTDVGYARQRVASTPLNAAEAAKFQLQPHETNADGVVAYTRQEINLPIDTGFSKIVPFVSGEAAYWGEDVLGNSLARLTGQAGYRSSTPISRVFPNVQNSLFNVNGLAHKLTFESQFLYADTNKDLDQLPLYNPIDDNAQEHFRRRLVFNTFGGVLPGQFDSTNYAARQSMQRYVTATSNEVVTDQLQSRTGIHQRWQTKRGVPGRERIADLVEFDVDAILFGRKDEDNFGELVGGINYDFRYHIGDRVTLVSDGYYDMFENGLKATTIGGYVSRPGRGDAYLGLTSLEGPISSTLLVASMNYRMNEKWLAVGGMTYDFSDIGNLGQSISFTRIGESFLIRVGTTFDYGRNNTSFQFAIEPRFFQRRGLGVAGGQAVALAGANSFE